MEYATRTTRLEKFYQEGQACAENVAPQTKDRPEIASVVDDLTSAIDDLRVKLDELSGRLAPMRIADKERAESGYASPGYGSELGEKLGQLLAKEKAQCAFVDTLIRELAI